MKKLSPVIACVINQDGGNGRMLHYCPACDQLHFLPETWQFDGNLDSPSFSPSFRQMRVRDGKDCHYNITNGQIVWHSDSWHGRTGTEPMIVLDTVDWLKDW